MRKIAIVLVLMVLVTGCGVKETPATEITASETSPATKIAIPTNNATPRITKPLLNTDQTNKTTPTLIPTSLPTPSYYLSGGTPVPGSGESLTTDNISQLTELAIWGYGSIDKVEFAIENRFMIVQTGMAIYAYIAGTLDVQWRIYIPTGVSAMSISTNQKWIAYGTYDSTIHIIRAEDGKEIQHWLANETWTGNLGFSSDDLMLASSDNDNYARVWDISTMELIMEHKFKNDLADVFFTNGDNWVAARVWNPEYGYEYFFLNLTTFEIEERTVHPDTMLAFLPKSNFYVGDGQIVEIGSFNKLNDLVDVPEGLSDWWGPLSVDISDDGSLLAVGLLTTGVGIWRVSDGTLVGIYEPEDLVYSSSGKVNAPMPRTGPGEHKTNSVDISADNRLVVATNGFGEIYLWEIESGNLITRIEGFGWFTRISPNMDSLVSYTYDSLAMYSIPTGKLTAAIPGEWAGADLFFTPNSTRLANGSRVWDLETGELEHAIFGESIVGISHNGLTYFTISSHWRLRQRSTVDLEQIEQVKLDISGIDGEYLIYMGNWRISPDNSMIYGTAYGAPLISWYIEDGSFASFNGNIINQVIGYSSDASYYAIYNDINEEIEVHKVLDGHPELLNSILFEGDSPSKITLSLETNMIIVNSDPFLYIFDFITGDQIFSGEIPHEYGWYSTSSVAITADGKLLAVMGDNTISFYDLIGGEFLSTIKGTYFSVKLAAFSPDGKLLATVDYDGIVRLWGIPND